LLHGRDGELLHYRDLVLSFEPEQPVYGIQPVGLDGRGQPSLSVPQMAAHYVEELRAALPEGPYLLAGYCFSGILAYEVANQLAAQGHAPTFLGLIDAVPSGVVRRRSRIELERTKFADFRSRNLRGKAEWVARRIRGLRTKAGTRLQFVLYEIFDRTGRALPRQLRDVERAMGKALSGYSSPESDVHVTLFRAARDTTDTTPNRSHWARLARQVDRHLIVADGIQHDNMMRLPYAKALAAEMSRCIKRSLEELQPDEVGSREKQES
jgi:thioesterase domain-containing protein